MNWTPPQNPGLFQLLDEAQDDADAGRHAEALRKYRWFHANALKYDQGMAGVRLSFALGAWLELAKKHPPAMAELKRIRDAAERKVLRISDKFLVFEPFHDFSAINRYLKEEARTVKRFVWLDAERPMQAKRVFHVARPALIKARQYSLCNRYIEADDYDFILHIYKLDEQRLSREPKDAASTLTKAQARNSLKFDKKLSVDNFICATCTLVALLVQNNRRAEAKRVSAEAKRASANGVKFRDLPKLVRALAVANQGKVPRPRP